MSVWKAIFLGLLQGFTEFLPVSSSGHLAVAQNFFGFDSGQSVTFTVLLHLGTLAAVCIMYRRDVWMIIKGFFTLVGKLFTGRLRREGLESGERLFLLLLRALAYLSYDTVAPRRVTAVFLMGMMSLLGFRPQVGRCAQCGTPIALDGRADDDYAAYFGAQAGGVLCEHCGAGGGVLAGLLFRKVPARALHLTLGALILLGGVRLLLC